MTTEAPARQATPLRGGLLGSGRTVQIGVVGLVILIIAWLALVPLFYLLWGTFFEDGRLTLDAFRRAYTAFGLGAITYNSLMFSVGAMAVSVSAGTGLAYLTERTDVPLRGFIFIGALVPLIIPGILYTIAWVFVASPRTGVLNSMLEPLLGQPLMDVFSMTGMIVVQGLDNAPLAFLLMVAAFRSMDPSLEESALMSGAGMPRVLSRITLPLALPAIAGAALLLTVRNLETFETPAILGIPADIWVFTSRIWRVLSQFPLDYGQAGAYGVSLLILCTIGIILYNRMSSQGKKFQTVSGKGFRPRRVALRKWRWPVAGLTVLYFFVALGLPLFMLVWMSAQPFTRMPSMAALETLTLDHYRYILDHPQVVRAFWNSLVLGVGSATVVMLLTAIAAWVVIKTQLPGRWVLDNLTFVPLVFPGLVLGVALLFMYLRVPGGIAVYGTLWILLIAYCTRFMPYGMRYAVASMVQISDELEESGRTSGATWLQILRRIVLPLLGPGLIAGWVYVLIVSVRELSASILLYSPGSEVLAIVVWEMWENGEVQELSALGVLMIVLLSVLVVAAQWTAKKVGLGGVGE